jgi:hypothetical protein
LKDHITYRESFGGKPFTKEAIQQNVKVSDGQAWIACHSSQFSSKDVIQPAILCQIKISHHCLQLLFEFDDSKFPQGLDLGLAKRPLALPGVFWVGPPKYEIWFRLMH